LESLAVAACAAVGADHAGVDLVRDRDGRLHVLEVNGIPAWRGLQGTTTLDIAARVVDDFLCRQTE
jgi:glutathione synthase/RimK-type ligase-like ATP-grasp enzyme